jgi:hypothetical protein
MWRGHLRDKEPRMIPIRKSFGWALVSLAVLAISGCSMQGSGGADGPTSPASYRHRTTIEEERDAERDHIMSAGRAPIVPPTHEVVA